MKHLPPVDESVLSWLAGGIERQPGAALVALLTSIMLPFVAVPLLVLPFAAAAPAAYIFVMHPSLGFAELLWMVASFLIGLGVIAVGLAAILAIGLVLGVFTCLPFFICAVIIMIITTAIEPWWLRTVSGYRRLSHDERRVVAERRLPGTLQTAAAAGPIHPAKLPRPAASELQTEEALRKEGTDTGTLIDAAQKLGLLAVPPVLVDDADPLVHARTYARAIVVSAGFIYAAPEIQRGIFAHELAHWSGGYIPGMRFQLWACGMPVYLIEVVRNFLNPRNVFGLGFRIAFWPVHFIWLFTILPMVMRNGREEEYAADAAAAHVFKDYPQILGAIREFEPVHSGWERTIHASHPPIALRIERTQAPYRDIALPPPQRPWPLWALGICCAVSGIVLLASLVVTSFAGAVLPLGAGSATAIPTMAPVLVQTLPVSSTPTPSPVPPTPTATSLPPGPLLGTWHEIRRTNFGYLESTEHQTITFFPDGRFTSHADPYTYDTWTGTYRLGPGHSLDATSTDHVFYLRGTYQITRRHRLRITTGGIITVVFSR